MLSYKSVLLALFVSFVTAVYIDASGATWELLKPTVFSKPPVEQPHIARIESMNAISKQLLRIKNRAIETKEWEQLHGAFRVEPGKEDKVLAEKIAEQTQLGNKRQVAELVPNANAIQLTKAIRLFLADEKVGPLFKLEHETQLDEFDKLVAMKKDISSLQKKIASESNDEEKSKSLLMLDRLQGKYNKDLLESGNKWLNQLPDERKVEFQNLRTNVRRFFKGLDANEARTGIEGFAVSTSPSQVKFGADRKMSGIDVAVSKDLIEALYGAPKIETTAPQEKRLSSSSSSSVDRPDDSSLDLEKNLPTRKNSFSSSSSSTESRSDDSRIEQEQPYR